MAFEERQQQDRICEAKFAEFRKTAVGNTIVHQVLEQFPGLKQTNPKPEDSSWFLRQMSTPGSYLRTICLRSHHDPDIRPPLSDYQLVALSLLMCHERYADQVRLKCNIQRLFPYFRKAKDWWFPKPEDRLGTRLWRLSAQQIET